MIAETVRVARQDDWFPLVLSGNCNAAVGSVCGCGCDTTGLVWFGISILTGQCWKKLAGSLPGFAPVPGEHIALVGARDIEPDEVTLLDRVSVARVSVDDDPLGAVNEIASKTTGLYVHLDLDVLDPTDAVANQWSPPGRCPGLNSGYRAIFHLEGWSPPPPHPPRTTGLRTA